MTDSDRFLRYDLCLIDSWVEKDSRVLDLGCGRGELLYELKKNKNVRGAGIELKEEKAAECLEKGLSVIQGDVHEEIAGYPDGVFDYVILSQTLQQAYDPLVLLRESLRIGRVAIVSFPNFSHWTIRKKLLFSGGAPVTDIFPYQWYETPNIRVLSINDFRNLSQKAGFRILREHTIKTSDTGEWGKKVRFFPNLRATYGLFLVKGEKTPSRG